MTIAGDDWCNEIFGWQWMMRQMEQSQFGGCALATCRQPVLHLQRWFTGFFQSRDRFFDGGKRLVDGHGQQRFLPMESDERSPKIVRCLWDFVVDGGWCFFCLNSSNRYIGKYSLSLPGQLFCWVVVSNIFYVQPYFGKWSSLIILPARIIKEVSPGLNFCFHSQECSGSSHFSFK